VLKPCGFTCTDNAMTPHQKSLSASVIFTQHQPGFAMKITKPLAGKGSDAGAEQGATIETFIAAQWRVE